MINASLPYDDGFDHIAELQAIISRKDDNPVPRRTTLTAIFQRLRNRYNEFLDHRHTLERVTLIPRTVDEIEALGSCYKSGTKFYRSLLAPDFREYAAPLPRCPYCQIEIARTWDHFLPSSQYPDFFVFRPNLVRVCHHCNERKGDTHVSPIRQTIHPYFDALSDVRYLACDVEYDQQLTLTFRIDSDITHPDYDPNVEGVVQEHFRVYGLERIFRAEASSKVTSLVAQARLCEQVKGMAPDQATIDLIVNGELIALARRGNHLNHWETAFWNGARACPDLLTYVQAQL